MGCEDTILGILKSIRRTRRVNVDKTLRMTAHNSVEESRIVRPPAELTYNVIDFDEVDRIVESLPDTEFLVEGLIPRGELFALFGKSGLGKTPFMYQMMLCMAAGRKFVGHSTKRCSVLYMGSEDKLKTTHKRLSQMARYLGLSEGWRKNFLTWDRRNAKGHMAQDITPMPAIPNAHTFHHIVKAWKPDFVVLDTALSFLKGLEKDSITATTHTDQMRALMDETGCTIGFIHHLKKLPMGKDGERMDLETMDFSEIEEYARGSNVLTTGIDTRLFFGKASTKGAEVFLRGRLRSDGEVPTILFGREYDPETWEPQVYCPPDVQGMPPDQAQVFNSVPSVFRFTELNKVMKKVGEAIGKDITSKGTTSKWVKGWLEKRFVEKAENGDYRKLIENPPTAMDAFDMTDLSEY